MHCVIGPMKSAFSQDRLGLLLMQLKQYAHCTECNIWKMQQQITDMCSIVHPTFCNLLMPRSWKVLYPAKPRLISPAAKFAIPSAGPRATGPMQNTAELSASQAVQHNVMCQLQPRLSTHLVVNMHGKA